MCIIRTIYIYIYIHIHTYVYRFGALLRSQSSPRSPILPGAEPKGFMLRSSGRTCPCATRKEIAQGGSAVEVDHTCLLLSNQLKREQIQQTQSQRVESCLLHSFSQMLLRTVQTVETRESRGSWISPLHWLRSLHGLIEALSGCILQYVHRQLRVQHA